MKINPIASSETDYLQRRIEKVYPITIHKPLIQQGCTLTLSANASSSYVSNRTNITIEPNSFGGVYKYVKRVKTVVQNQSSKNKEIAEIENKKRLLEESFEKERLMKILNIK